jgi:ribosome-binding protein aMBF1 (putative translation factor)
LVDETQALRAQARRQAARARRTLDHLAGVSQPRGTTVGDRIRRLRLERSLSQRQLTAGVLHCSCAYVSRIELGQRIPSARVLEELADRLETTALYLASGSPESTCPYCRRAAMSPATT